MPAPAVIPASIAYINAAAVKKLVVGSRVQVVGCHGSRNGVLSLAVYGSNILQKTCTLSTMVMAPCR